MKKKSVVKKNVIKRVTKNSKKNLTKSSKKKDFQFEVIPVVISALIVVAFFTQIFFSPLELSKKLISVERTNDGFIDRETKEDVKISIIDFPSSDQGTFSGWINEKYFKEPIDNKVVLFASVRVPGVALTYYPNEKQLVGGTPEMTARNVLLFDGKKHQIAYTFKKGGKQSLFYDGKLMEKSNFQFYNKDQLTGMFIGLGQPVISESVYEVDIR